MRMTSSSIFLSPKNPQRAQKPLKWVGHLKHFLASAMRRCLYYIVTKFYLFLKKLEKNDGNLST